MVLAILLSALSMVRRNTLDFELSVTPVECIRSLRTLCEEKGWKLERHEGSRLVDRFAIIMPMAQTARTLGLRVLDGPLTGLELTTWSEVRGSAEQSISHLGFSQVVQGILKFNISCNIGFLVYRDAHGDGRLENGQRLDIFFQHGKNHASRLLH